MGLKELEIIGFKSFAKKTKIQFADGINAIVGPNGCGKSNIVDAFLWALGEQSAKTLRGAKMHDVIFAGSEKQKALNAAEVTITFDNRNNFLPISYQEVAVTRKIYRDDSSDYILNKQQVRLKDVQELFANTGLGHETVAVIGQGRVEKIISQSPQDRRAMFEEVAGILHFLVKRKESLQKLERTEINVSRAQDILKEVEAQKLTLDKQAADAKKFQNDRDRLALLEDQLIALRLHEAKAELERVVGTLSDLEKERENVNKSEQEVKLALNVKKEELKKLQLLIAEISFRQHDLKNSQQVATKEIAFANEQEKEHAAKLNTALRELSTLDQQAGKFVQEKEAIEKEKDKAKLDCAQLVEAHDLIEQKVTKSSEQHQKEEAAIKMLFAKRSQLQNSIQSLENELRKGQLAFEVASEKHKMKEAEAAECRAKISRFGADIEEKKKQQQEVVEQVAIKKERVSQLVQKVQEYDKELVIQNKEGDELKKQLFELEARHKVVMRSILDMEGFSQAVKSLIGESKKSGSPLYGKLMPFADYVDIDNILISSLYDSTLVVETLQDLQLCLAHVAGKKQELSFLCLEFLGVKTKDELKVHLLQAVASASSIDESLNVKRPFYTAAGHFVDALGIIFVGQEKEHNLVQRKRQLKELELELEQLKVKRAAFEEKIVLLQKEKTDLSKMRQEEDEAMRKLDYGVVSATFQLQELEKQKLRVTQDVERIVQDIARFTELLTSVQGQKSEQETKLLALKKEAEGTEQAYKEKELQFDSFKKEHSRLVEERRVLFSRLQDAKTKLQRLTHAEEVAQVQDKEAKKRSELFLNQKKQSEETLKLTADKQAEKKEQVLQTEKELAAIKLQLEEKNELAKGFEKAVLHVEQALLEKQQAKEKCSNSIAAKEVEKAHLVAESAKFSEALQEKEVTLPEGLTRVQIEETTRRLRNSLERNRNVNLMAIDELREVLDRHRLLVEQLADLSTTKNELVSIIADLEKESRNAFKETFEAIRVAFKRHFQTLFNGGEADLVLAEGDDPLDAGVEIMAKPPGKQMRSMQLMSGGEKGLTALALLFGCFEVRPSPFCILDEVDAALDEANVERLGKLLQSFAGKLQFLVITHNKRTMAVADALIGVSMQEKGVSQIISLDFKKVEKTTPEMAATST